MPHARSHSLTPLLATPCHPQVKDLARENEVLSAATAAAESEFAGTARSLETAREHAERCAMAVEEEHGSISVALVLACEGQRALRADANLRSAGLAVELEEARAALAAMAREARAASDEYCGSIVLSAELQASGGTPPLSSSLHSPP